MLNEEQINIRIKDATKEIEKDGQYINYRHSDILDFADIYKICNHFKDKGCHAKINYFADGRRPYQCFIIQNHPFNLSRQGMMITSEILF